MFFYAFLYFFFCFSWLYEQLITRLIIAHRIEQRVKDFIFLYLLIQTFRHLIGSMNKKKARCCNENFFTLTKKSDIKRNIPLFYSRWTMKTIFKLWWFVIARWIWWLVRKAHTADLCLLGWLFSLLWKEQVEERYIMDRNQYNYKFFFYIFFLLYFVYFFSACNIDFIQSIIFHSLNKKKKHENYSEGIYDWSYILCKSSSLWFFFCAQLLLIPLSSC